MWLLRGTNNLLITLATGLLFGWTYFLTAYYHVVDESKVFSYFPLIWGGSLLLLGLSGIRSNRTIAGAWSFTYRLNLKPYTICLVVFTCAFTLRLLNAVSTRFDVDHLAMPYFLPYIFIPLHFLIVSWILFRKTSSEADRGLFLLLLFHTLNGAVFSSEFYVILAFATITFLEALIENRGRWELPPLAIGLPLFALVCLALFSSVNAINPVKSTQALSNVGVCAAISALVALRRRETGFLLKLFGVLLFSSFLVILTVVIQFLMVSAVIGATPYLTSRLTIFHQHPNFLAPYFALTAFLALALIPVRKERYLRLVLALLALLLLSALWLTDSRAGYLSFCAGLGVFLLFILPIQRGLIAIWRRLHARGRKAVLIGGALGLLALAVLTAVYSGPALSTLRENTRLRRAQDYRLDAWANSLEIIEDHPLHGVGMNTFLSEKKFPPGSKFSHETSAPHPHNLFLYIAQSCGIPALVAFLFLMGGLFWIALVIVRKLYRSQLRFLIVSVLAASTTLVTCGLFDLGLALLTLFPGPLWLFLGITAAIYNSRLNDKLRAIHLGGIRSVFPAAAILLITVYGGFFPTLSRTCQLRAQLADREGDLKEGIRIAKQAMRFDPLYNGAKAYLLRCYLKKRDYDQALELIQKASRLEPKNSGFHLLHGDILCLRQEHSEAVKKYRLAVAVDHGSPNLPQYYAKLVALEAQCGLGSEARADLKTAIQRNIAVINLIRWETELLPEGRNDQFLTLGETEETLRLEEVLEEIYQELRSSHEAGTPQDRFNWFSLFQSFKNALNYERALAILDDMENIFQDKERSTIQFQRALIAKEQEDLTLSEAYLNAASQQGDATNPAAAKEFQATLNALVLTDEKNAEEVFAKQRQEFASLRDFRTFRITFIKALDNLLQASDRAGKDEEMIPFLKARLFFATDLGNRLAFRHGLAKIYAKVERLHPAEQTLLKAVEDIAGARIESMGRLEDPRVRSGLKRIAQLLVKVYRDLGCSPEAGLKRARTTPQFYSAHPARLLFRCDLLMEFELYDRAVEILELALMDAEYSILLLELKAACNQVLDDPDGLHKTYQAISRAHHARRTDLDARLAELFSAVYADQDNIPLILELVTFKSYSYKFDHCLNMLREAIKLHPEVPALYYMAARIHRLNNDPEQAAESLRQALHLDPDHQQASKSLQNLQTHMAEEKGGDDALR